MAIGSSYMPSGDDMPKMNSQAKKNSGSFEEGTKRIGATNDEVAFEAKLKKIAKAKPIGQTGDHRKK